MENDLKTGGVTDMMMKTVREQEGRDPRRAWGSGEEDGVHGTGDNTGQGFVKLQGILVTGLVPVSRRKPF